MRMNRQASTRRANVQAGLGASRRRFAWWPVRLWKIVPGQLYVRPSRRFVWLRPVVEVLTFEGWTAYIHHQPKGSKHD